MKRIGKKMPNVILNWNANPPVEQVSAYTIYRDGASIATVSGITYTDPDVQPGSHVYEVSATNAWGEGPKSDPISTLLPPSKVSGLTIQVVVTVTVP
jgi:hypothetical protein